MVKPPSTAIRHTDARHYRTRKDGGARSALLRRDPGLQHEHCTVEVDTHHLAVGVQPGAVQRRYQRAANAVRQQRWCSAQRFLAGGDGQRRAFRRGGVGGDTQGRLHIGQALSIAPHCGDAAALGKQLTRQGSADAPAGTGNKGDRSDGVCSVHDVG